MDLWGARERKRARETAIDADAEVAETQAEPVPEQVDEVQEEGYDVEYESA